MTLDDVRTFLERNHSGILITLRRSGAAQASLVASGLLGDGVACTTREGAAKLANVRRDPRCTMMVTAPDRSGYVVVEGIADIYGPDRTAPEELRLKLREAYTACAGQEHPNWLEYDQAMLEQERSVIIVRPQHVYRSGR